MTAKVKCKNRWSEHEQLNIQYPDKKKKKLYNNIRLQIWYWWSMNPYKKMAELYIIQYCKLSLVTWFCRHCSKEKTLKNLERVSAMCCCTISRPIRKQISAMRLRVFRHTAERVCTPQGKLNTEGKKVRGQLRLLLFFF